MVLSRKGEDFTQKELESKRVKSSRIKPKEEKFQKPILGDNVLYTHHTEHTNIFHCTTDSHFEIHMRNCLIWAFHCKKSI